MFKEKLIQNCLKDWEFFGQQEYNVDGKEIRAGHKEFEDGEEQRIGEYWKFLNMDLDGRDRNWPWSAVFVSFMQHLAGAGKYFEYSIRHSDYLNQAIKDKHNTDALYNGYPINTVAVKVGDILGYSRAGAGVNYDNALSKGRYTSHSDIVVAVFDNIVDVMGGNIGDSVSKRHYALIAGKIDVNVRPWVCHMSLNEDVAKKLSLV